MCTARTMADSKIPTADYPLRKGTSVNLQAFKYMLSLSEQDPQNVPMIAHEFLVRNLFGNQRSVQASPVPWI